ncbi:ferric reductase [Malaciobacter halophilus]|uniref:Ferric reductase n=1 Tax=Malaciobacter halophilus TaxID=197482 RepID=A0A2N1J0U4_9BACT|nr:ferric reductase-like transmembrane domain-containing protein [Malaciobacter halophilus]AXH09011.1 periplasmic DMSO/TMAO reductase YedYZ, heme-binding membrane subunit [Malaciobacter halophilus]PKI80188.1 ferric reductase [Malaciobacter halophilus]
MKYLLVIFFLIPLIVTSYELFILENINDPIKYIYTVTGVISTVLLFFTICLSMIKKWVNLIKFRKLIGVFGFFYAFLHFLNFIVLDAQLDISFIIKQTIDKPFIYLGMIAFFIVLFMAITSTKTLFKKFNNYHKLIYLALILITIHFVMAQKSLTFIQFVYIIVILAIGYSKLLQQIIRRNRV